MELGTTPSLPSFCTVQDNTSFCADFRIGKIEQGNGSSTRCMLEVESDGQNEGLAPAIEQGRQDRARLVERARSEDTRATFVREFRP